MKVAHLSEPAEERVIFRDGLGVRERRDTGTGELVEWFHLDPAFASVELPLRERVTRLAKFQHVKFARILGLELPGKDRSPILISTHVPGSRLSDVLDMAGHGLITFEPGAGLQVLRDVLGALAVLHDSRNVAHGALGPERVVLTPTGRVVMVEHVLAAGLDRLQRPRHQLWREWRVPTPPAAGPVRFDMQTDLAQVGLLGLAVLLGRSIDEEEYPHRLRGLLPLVQDRLSRSPSAPIAADVASVLERLAPLDSKRAFKSVRDAQQALEALFAGGGAALGASPARVKSVVAAVAAIAAAEAAPATAEAVPTTEPVIVSSASARRDSADSEPVDLQPTAGASTAEPDIDIEALLALEAELEGGSPVSASPPLFASSAGAAAAGPVGSAAALPPTPRADDERPLDALAQERLDLERQFAELVASVAPAPADEPVHLIPETPETSEPLVDARVVWSSMPASDEPESSDVTDSAGTAPETGALLSAVEFTAPASDEEPVPFADTSVFSRLALDAANEPLLVVTSDEARPTAAIEHVPAEWWKEALPWRDERAAVVDVVDDDAPAPAAEEQAVPEDVASDAESRVEHVADEVADVPGTVGVAGDGEAEAVGDAMPLADDEFAIAATAPDASHVIETAEIVEVAEIAGDAEAEAVGGAIPLVEDELVVAAIVPDASHVVETAEIAALTDLIEVVHDADDVEIAIVEAAAPAAGAEVAVDALEGPVVDGTFVHAAHETGVPAAVADVPAVADVVVDAPEVPALDGTFVDATHEAWVPEIVAEVPAVADIVVDAPEVPVVDHTAVWAVHETVPAIVEAPAVTVDTGAEVDFVEAIPVAPDAAAQSLDVLAFVDAGTADDAASAAQLAPDTDLVIDAPELVADELTATPAIVDDETLDAVHDAGVPLAVDPIEPADANVPLTVDPIEPADADVPLAVDPIEAADADTPGTVEGEWLAAIELASEAVAALGEDAGDLDGAVEAQETATDPAATLAALEPEQEATVEPAFHLAVDADAPADVALEALADDSNDTRPADADAGLVPAQHDFEAPALEGAVGAPGEPVVEDVASERDASAVARSARPSAAAAGDTLEIADVTLGGDEAMAPVGGYRLFGEIEPILLQSEDALQEQALPATQPVDDAPLFAATALFSKAPGGDNAPDWRAALLGGKTGPDAATAIESGFFWTSSHRDDVEPTLDEPVEMAQAAIVASEPASGPVETSPREDAPTVDEPAVDALAVDEPAPVIEPQTPAPADARPDAAPPGAAPLLDVPSPIDLPEPVPQSMADVVILDDDSDGNALDDLPSEMPASAVDGEASVEPTAESEVSTGVSGDSDGAAIESHASEATSASKKKRRRSRRKKGAAAIPAPPAPIVIATRVGAVVAPDAAPAAIEVPSVSQPEPLLDAIVPASMAISLTPSDPPVVAPVDDATPEMTARKTSLLAREVPKWTPPSDFADMRPRVHTPVAQRPPVAAALSVESVVAERHGSALPAGAHHVDGAVDPTHSAAALAPMQASAPAQAPTPAPVFPASPTTSAFGVMEPSRPFEQEIRAVGMPDLEELNPKPARGTVTALGDPFGSAVGQAKRSAGAGEPWTPTPITQPEPGRGGRWKRFIAASVLIALFQGAAFAAWWWVQPGARGTLVVQTAKSGVEVLLDDKVVGRTPFREEIAPGRHKLQLRQGTNVREMPVEISVGVVTTQTLEWPSSTGGKGHLQVTSNPAGAEIVIAGQVRGTTPMLLEDLPAGDQVLTLRGDAGAVTVKAMVVADETTPLEVKIFAGWIVVDAPVEVNLLLNGREKIGSSMDGQILLPPGTHRLRAVNDALGIRQWLNVTVEPGAVERVTLSVPPGTLTLQEPGEVSIDGAPAGTTPGSIKIPPGTHEIAVRLADGTERRQTLTVRAGQRVEF